jgi:hypothetical protein
VTTPDSRAANAKPTDQVGFTKVTTAQSNNVFVPPGAQGELIATCPAGSTVIGGTIHYLTYFTPASPPWIISAMNDKNGWDVTVVNQQSGAGNVNFYAVAYCAS